MIVQINAETKKNTKKGKIISANRAKSSLASLITPNITISKPCANEVNKLKTP